MMAWIMLWYYVVNKTHWNIVVKEGLLYLFIVTCYTNKGLLYLFIVTCYEQRIVVLIYCYLLRTKDCCTYSLLLVTNKGLLYLFIVTCNEQRIVVLIHCYLLRTKDCCTYSLLLVTNKELLYLFTLHELVSCSRSKKRYQPYVSVYRIYSVSINITVFGCGYVSVVYCVKKLVYCWKFILVSRGNCSCALRDKEGDVWLKYLELEIRVLVRSRIACTLLRSTLESAQTPLRWVWEPFFLLG
jgi:hypothetical protein